MAPSILRLPSVQRRTGLSRSTIYQKISHGAFPRPVALGARAVGWVEQEVSEWLTAQIERSRSGGTRAAQQPVSQEAAQ